MRVLIGSTGFVGSALSAATGFDVEVHRSNVEMIKGLSAEVVVCAGLPAAKWLANQDPQGDRDNMLRLAGVLDSVTAERFVIISTIDVYQPPVGCDETTAANVAGVQAYGRHRAQFEELVLARFPNVLVLRLPGLYGTGLRKNLIFDLLQGSTQQYQKVNRDSRFQFFDVGQTWAMVEAAWDGGLTVLNVATEPVTAQSVADLFGVALGAEGAPVNYDMRSVHALRLGIGGAGPYLEDADSQLAAIAELKANWKWIPR